MICRSIRRLPRWSLLCGAGLVAIVIAPRAVTMRAAPAPADGSKTVSDNTTSWADDLSSISVKDWNVERAAHLLERAGFGGTPEEIARLAGMTPQQAVDWLVDYEKIDNASLKPFDESGIWDAGM